MSYKLIDVVWCGPCDNNCMLSYFLMEMFTKVQQHKKWEICLTFSTQRYKKNYFLFICGIFKKLPIQQKLPSLKIIIWYKKLSFGISRLICSYLIGSFQNFLEEILTRNFLGIEVVLKLSLFAHWRWWWVALKGQ